MKKPYKFILVFTLSLFFALSCSRKKDKFINRSFHAVTAEFNPLFNGYNALEQGKEVLNEAYFDNYWEVLPIERMQILEDIVLPSQSKNENFNRAEEKAAKAIQKHSMNIDGKERDPQMDEAYLLLGKARYFDQRFVPALEAFNYILYKYPASDKINQAKVWREKANIRLDNNDLAIENLKRLLKQEDLEGQDLADATSILAQAYLNIKVIDTAITQLEIASSATKNNDERGRYRFIQGQLYNKLGFKDSANMAFDKVIKLRRRTPRIYLISAYLEKVKNFDFQNGDKLEMVELLTKLEEYRENRPYLDKIYHQIGAYHLQNKQDSLAVSYYNKSLRTDTPDKLLKAKNYKTLGDINFNASVYATAGKYYDSTMSNLRLNSKPYRVIKRKRDNLKDVIYYERIARVNDSVLRLINLSEPERLAYFSTIIQDLKVEIEAEKEKKEAAARNTGLGASNNAIGSLPPRTNNQGTANNFYFYNPTTVAYGKNEFVKVWGDRKLKDNWRWASRGTLAESNQNNQIAGPLSDATIEERFDPDFYISKIPSTKKVIDSISQARNYAYYQLGLIYKEKYKEYELAKHKLQNLLDSNPAQRLILPAKYNLFKIYELLGQNAKATKIKSDIIESYPESRYAAILKNPELITERDQNSPESLYEALYKKHQNQEYAQVIFKSEEYIKTFDGTPIVPKFELLKATATARLHGYEAYEKAIKHLAITYANTPEGKQAQNIETNILPKLSNKDFVSETDSVPFNYKIIYKFQNAAPKQVSEFKETLDVVLKKVRYYNLKSSFDVYNENTNFVVVHGIKSIQVAKTFNQLISIEDQKKITKSYFVAASPNYQIIQIHKNLDTYLNLYNN